MYKRQGYNEYLGGNQFDSSGNLKEQSETNAYKMTNTLNQAFVAAVRGTGRYNAQRVLIVSGYWTNIDLSLIHISYLKELREDYTLIEYLGIAADETKRIKDKNYPLVEWGCLLYTSRCV